MSATSITVKVIDGWPCISESLQWAEECPLYLMGQYAALQVGLHLWSKKQISTSILVQNLLNLNFPPTQIGPHAVNLAGGQAASMRIAKAITGRQERDVLKVSELSGEKSKTEEYVQQMKGLLWL